MRGPARTTHHRPQHRRPRPTYPHLTGHTQITRHPRGPSRRREAGVRASLTQLGRPGYDDGSGLDTPRADRGGRRHGRQGWCKWRLVLARPRVIARQCGIAPGLP
jgi:hypothetical protein